MLSCLIIQNVVLIEHLNINFQENLCTLTGETGAGKSILLDSLGLAIGARAEARLVRKGTDQAQVTATFELPPDHDVFTFLQIQDITIPAEEELILRRTLKSDGRSKAFLNDQPVSISLLSQIGEMLVEVHGQFDTHGLLNPKTHRGHLDDYAGLAKDVADLAALWDQWKAAQSKFRKAEQDAETARVEEEFLRQSVEDLDNLSPIENEEEELSSLRERLMNREQVLQGLNEAYHVLNGETDPVNAAMRFLDRISDKAGSQLDDAIAALDRANAELQEASSLIQSASTNLSESEYNLQEIDDRLFALKAQARKHQCTISDLPAKRDELAAQLNLIERTDDILSGLLKQTNTARKAYIEKADHISEIREKIAKKLDQEVAQELPPLKMDKATFKTSVEPLEEEYWNEFGKDRVRFLVATNPGSEPGPLGKIASGGEMARFMLALKVILAEIGPVQTLIFDEVDSGVGGATADAVGERLARLGKKRQVLVVTHSPQVAARAGSHWIVQKDGNAEQVTTNVVSLETKDHRREEIARMLSGAEITEEARQAAEKLLEGKAA